MEPDGVVDSEVVLRRFDPNNPNHYSLDESLNQKRLRSSGLRFDDYEGFKGCSVYQESVLSAEGLSNASILEKDTWLIVGAEVKKIRALEHGEHRPFDAVSNAYPDGTDGAFPADVAHALITHPDTLPRGPRDKLMKKLARDVFEEMPAQTYEEGVAAAESNSPEAPGLVADV